MLGHGVCPPPSVLGPGTAGRGMQSPYTPDLHPTGHPPVTPLPGKPSVLGKRPQQGGARDVQVPAGSQGCSLPISMAAVSPATAQPQPEHPPALPMSSPPNPDKGNFSLLEVLRPFLALYLSEGSLNLTSFLNQGPMDPSFLTLCLPRLCLPFSFPCRIFTLRLVSGPPKTI